MTGGAVAKSNNLKSRNISHENIGWNGEPSRVNVWRKSKYLGSKPSPPNPGRKRRKGGVKP